MAKAKSVPYIENGTSYVMPAPGAVVEWRPFRNGDMCYAIVTGRGRSAIDVFVVPSQSRIGEPKMAVRHISDPWIDQHGVLPDAGVWDHTQESKLLRELAFKVLGETV